MKKKLTSMVLSIGIMASTVAGITTVYADDNISVELNGQKLQFEVQPQIIDDYTMVPMRTIFEALGYVVTWDQEEQTITALRGQQMIMLTVDSTKYSNCDLKELSASNDVLASLQNTTYELDIAPIIIDDNTLVPLRAVSEMAGCTVDWDGSTKTVNITGKVYSKLDILNEYLINNCIFSNGEYVATYDYDNYTIIIGYNPSKNTTKISLVELLDEPIMGYLFTHWTTIYLDANLIYCIYEEVGGTHIEETIPTDFKTPISKGIYRTYPTGDSILGVESYYEREDKVMASYCNIAFYMFNMYMAKNYINLSAADFGVVLDN